MHRMPPVGGSAVVLVDVVTVCVVATVAILWVTAYAAKHVRTFGYTETSVNTDTRRDCDRKPGCNEADMSADMNTLSRYDQMYITTPNICLSHMKQGA